MIPCPMNYSFSLLKDDFKTTVLTTVLRLLENVWLANYDTTSESVTSTGKLYNIKPVQENALGFCKEKLKAIAILQVWF